MKETNIVFDSPEKKFAGFAVSRAELRRLSWHVENLKIVRLGRFQTNVDELTTGKLQNKHFM